MEKSGLNHCAKVKQGVEVYFCVVVLKTSMRSVVFYLLLNARDIVITARSIILIKIEVMLFFAISETVFSDCYCIFYKECRKCFL